MANIFAPFSGLIGTALEGAHYSDETNELRLLFAGGKMISVTMDSPSGEGDLLAMRIMPITNAWITTMIEWPHPVESVWWYVPAGGATGLSDEAVLLFGQMSEVPEWSSATFFYRAGKDVTPELAPNMSPIRKKREPRHKRDPWEYGRGMEIKKPR